MYREANGRKLNIQGFNLRGGWADLQILVGSWEPSSRKELELQDNVVENNCISCISFQIFENFLQIAGFYLETVKIFL